MRLSLARAVTVFRVAMLLLAAGLAAVSWGSYAHRGVAVAVLLAMAGWTVAASLPATGRAGVVLRVADVLVAVAAVLATRLVDTAARIDGGAATLPLAWAAVPALAAGVAAGPWAGAVAGLAIGLADVAERGAPTAANANSAILVIVAGGVVGYLARLVRRARAAEARAVAAEAADAERARLAADIHDSVLQVLALVARRGRDAGGPAADLARLAGEQEAVLRALVGSAPVAAGAGDLRGLLLGQARPRVEVVVPAGPVPVPAPLARELAAAVGAALDNVRAHAGAGARAWVLLESGDAAVRVTIRDDGAGMPAGRLAQAAGEGRLGVAAAIRGRVQRAGGTVTITSSPGAGTEVVIVVAG